MDICSLFCCGRRSKTSARSQKGGDGGRKGGAGRWRVFALQELHLATNSFNYDNKLGEGGFGSVYWGQLWDGSQVAVKRLKVLTNKAEQEFAGEVEILARVRHKNLVGLRGYCAEGQERLLVYEYIPELSVLSHLHGAQSSECLLDWGRRMSIAIGSAEGIAYLHSHATPHIIHRHIKASNVLLDSDFQARVADFGLARLIPDGVAHNAVTCYLAPEYAMHGQSSEACDVYSYGVFLLELASGKKPVEMLSPTEKLTVAEWALALAREGRHTEIADPKLKGKYPEAEMRRVVLVGLTCAQVEPEMRPSMLDVVGLLKGESKEMLASIASSELFLHVQESELR